MKSNSIEKVILGVLVILSIIMTIQYKTHTDEKLDLYGYKSEYEGEISLHTVKYDGIQIKVLGYENLRDDGQKLVSLGENIVIEAIPFKYDNPFVDIQEELSEIVKIREKVENSSIEKESSTYSVTENENSTYYHKVISTDGVLIYYNIQVQKGKDKEKEEYILEVFEVGGTNE